MIVPSIMCFVWFAFAGGTAIDLTLNGGAGDQITGAGLSSQLFAMINFMLSPTLATLMSVLIVILLMTLFGDIDGFGGVDHQYNCRGG